MSFGWRVGLPFNLRNRVARERDMPLESSVRLFNTWLDAAICAVKFLVLSWCLRVIDRSLSLLLAIGDGLIDVNCDVKAANDVMNVLFVWWGRQVWVVDAKVFKYERSILVPVICSKVLYICGKIDGQTM